VTRSVVRKWKGNVEKSYSFRFMSECVLFDRPPLWGDDDLRAKQMPKRRVARGCRNGTVSSSEASFSGSSPSSSVRARMSRLRRLFSVGVGINSSTDQSLSGCACSMVFWLFDRPTDAVRKALGAESGGSAGRPSHMRLDSRGISCLEASCDSEAVLKNCVFSSVVASLLGPVLVFWTASCWSSLFLEMENCDVSGISRARRRPG